MHALTKGISRLSRPAGFRTLRFWFFALFALVSPLSADRQESGQKPEPPSAREAFLEERQAMAREYRVLREEQAGLSEEERLEAIMTWRAGNAGRIERMQALAREMSNESRPPTRPPISLEAYEARLPESLSPTQRAFMLERFRLRQARADADLDDASLTPAAREQRRQAFFEAQQPRLQHIQSLAEALAEESTAQAHRFPAVAAGDHALRPPEALRQSLISMDPEARIHALHAWREQQRETRRALQAKPTADSTLSTSQPQQP